MEYQKHKCCDQNCDCFEISRVMDRIKSVTYYQVYNATKEAYAFLHKFFHVCSLRAHNNRMYTSFTHKALPPNTDHSSDTQGIPQCWTQAPPKRNTVRIFQAINNEHRDSKWRLKIPVFLGVRGVNNAPPSARKRNYVYQDLRYKNQQTDFAV